MREALNVPNLLTVIGIISAVFAIVFATHLHVATALVAFCAVVDYLDGKVARHLDSSSDLGAFLDSLHDMMAFVLAPAFVLWHVFAPRPPSMLLVSLAVYVLAGSYRLVRESRRRDSNRFLGLPIAPATLMLLGTVYLCNVLGDADEASVGGLSLVLVVLAAAMVSRIVIKRPF